MGLLAGKAVNGSWDQVQRGTIDHINAISATRMMVAPTPTRNNPTSGMSHPQSAFQLSSLS